MTVNLESALKSKDVKQVLEVLRNPEFGKIGYNPGSSATLLIDIPSFIWSQKIKAFFG